MKMHRAPRSSRCSSHRSSGIGVKGYGVRCVRFWTVRSGRFAARYTILCTHRSTATPTVVMQALQNLVVPAGTPFSTYLSELRLSLGNVRCVGSVAPEDGTLQIAIKTGVDDQFAGLGAQIFAGRNLRTLPFNSVDELMGS